MHLKFTKTVKNEIIYERCGNNIGENKIIKNILYFSHNK